MTTAAEPDEIAGASAAPSLAGRASAAGTLRLGGQLAKLVILVGLSMAMARLLTPADFGLFALVGTLSAFVATFRDFGLGHATIYARALSDEQRHAVLRVQLSLSGRLVLLMALAGPVLAMIYDEPRLVRITLVMALVNGIAALAVLPESLLSRRMRFGTLAGIEVGALLTSGVVGVGLAWAGAGYWALVAQAATDLLARTAALWLATPWRPDLRRLMQAPAAASSLVRYSREAVLSRAVNYAGQNLDLIVVGLVAGTAAAGLYSRAYQWATMPMLQVYGALLGVLVAGLSRARDDAVLFRVCARQLLLPIFALCLPAIAFIGTAAEAFVLVLLGEQWRDAAPLLRLFCAATFAGSALQVMKPIYLATGRTGRQLRWTLTAAPLTATAVLVGARWGMAGVALGFTVATCLLVLPGVWYGLRGSPLRLADMLGIVARPGLAAVGAAMLLAATTPLLPPLAAGPLAHLAAAAASYGLAYGLIWLGLPGGPRALRELLWAGGH